MWPFSRKKKQQVKEPVIPKERRERLAAEIGTIEIYYSEKLREFWLSIAGKRIVREKTKEFGVIRSGPLLAKWALEMFREDLKEIKGINVGLYFRNEKTRRVYTEYSPGYTVILDGSGGYDYIVRILRLLGLELVTVKSDVFNLKFEVRAL